MTAGAHLLNSLCWAVESKVAEVYAYTDNQDRELTSTRRLTSSLKAVCLLQWQ